MEINTIAARYEALKHKFDADLQQLSDLATPAEREDMGDPLKSIDKLTRFTANGHRYTIRTSLTVARFIAFEGLQAEVGFGVDFRDLFQNLRQVYDALNESRAADATVITYNIMNGVSRNLEQRLNPVLELCTLFICRDGEDLTIIDPALTADKINDWEKDGIDMDNFFTIALNFVNGFTPIYNQASASISQHLTKVKEEVGPRPKKDRNTRTASKPV